MWYAVETVFIDNKFFGSRLVFTPGDTRQIAPGHCLESHEVEPGNRCKKEFGDRIEIHLDWFETEELALQFSNGLITYKHTYEKYFDHSIKSTLSHFIKREIIKVDKSKGILPYKGLYEFIKLKNRPYWA